MWLNCIDLLSYPHFVNPRHWHDCIVKKGMRKKYIFGYKNDCEEQENACHKPGSILTYMGTHVIDWNTWRYFCDRRNLTLPNTLRSLKKLWHGYGENVIWRVVGHTRDSRVKTWMVELWPNTWSNMICNMILVRYLFVDVYIFSSKSKLLHLHCESV